MTFGDYLGYMYNDIPQDVYIISAIVLIVGGCFFLSVQGHKKGWNSTIILLALEYVFLVLGSTVIFRHTMKQRVYDFTPFWSYRQILNGDESGLIYENLMNIVVFIPFGFLMGTILQSKSLRYVIGIGCLLSFFVEFLQFIFAKGFSEIDDVIHNTLGCATGYSIYLLIVKKWSSSTNCCR